MNDIFFERIDDFVYGDCTDAEMSEFKKHMLTCEKCREEYEFSLSVKEAMSSMPKITPPADFSDSLNKRLDKELAKPARTSGYRKYSLVAACVALVAVLGIDSVNLTKDSVDNTKHLPFEKSDVSSVPVNTPEPDSEENLPLQNDITADVPFTYNLPGNKNSVSEASTTLSEPDQKPPAVTIKVPETKVAETPVIPETPVVTEKQTVDEPVSSYTVAVTTPQAPVVEKKTHPSAQTVTPAPVAEEVPEPTTPHTSVNYEKLNIPEYMDPREHVVLASTVENDYEIKSVKLEDLPVKERNLQAEFALLENPKTGSVIASPATLASLEGVQIQEIKSNRKGSDDYGIGSGSIFVSAKDIDFVTEILNKYLAGEDNNIYYLTNDNFRSFTDELDTNGISYTKRLVSQEGNITFKVVVS